MSDLFQQHTTPALLATIEDNLSEEVLCLGRGLPRCEIQHTSELLSICTGPGSGPNGVLQAAFKSDTLSSTHTQITTIINLFKQQHVRTMFWSVGPSSQPAQLGSLLETHHFKPSSRTDVMLMHTEQVNTESLTPPNFVIEEMEDAKTLQALIEIEIQGFGSSIEHAYNYYNGYLRAGFGNGTHWHHYLGRFNHQPVAIASLLLHANIAGIYGVATIPQARRLGIGAAMTLHALHQAHELGYHHAILAPTTMSERIYRRIGFQDCCTIQHYALPSTRT